MADNKDCTYEYDYADKCDCSEDDKCGCSYPNNMPHDFGCTCSEDDEDENTLNCDCFENGEYAVNTLLCNRLIVHEQDDDEDGCCGNSVLVREYAPDFIAPAVMPDNAVDDEFHLSEYIRGAYGLLFFYPADFTFICPSEIIAHNNRLAEFNKRGVKVIGVSVDSKHSHLAWKKMPVDAGGIGDIKFPLISDITKEISHDYGVLDEDGAALRASFLIDKTGIIRHQIVNDLSIGRDVDETLRVIDALQFIEGHGEVCPAGWHQGDKGMRPTPQGVADFLKENSIKL